MSTPADVKPGQRYDGWGKTWVVTKVWPTEGVAEARNVNDPANVIRWPLRKFVQMGEEQRHGDA